MLEDTAVVDNIVVSIGLNEADVDVVKRELPWVELPRSNTILLQVDISNATFSIYTSIVAGKSLYRLAAKIAVAGGSFAKVRAEARSKIRMLAERLSIEEILLKRDLRWNRLDLATYTPDLGEVDLMAWLVKAFEPVFQRKEDTKTKSAALSVGTKFTKFEYEGVTSGVRWVRSSGDHSLFSLTVYDKKSAVKKREAVYNTFTNMGEHEKKVAVNNAKLIDRVGNRLRVEVQVYPEAFFRGKAGKMREAVGMDTLDQKEVRKAEFLDKIDEDAAKCIMRNVVSSVGLRLAIRAWNQRTLENKVREVKDSVFVDRWLAGRKLSRKSRAVSEWDKLVESRLGFSPCDVPVETFVWIRRSLELFFIPEAEILRSDWNTVGLARARKEFLAQRARIRSVGWLKTFLFKE